MDPLGPLILSKSPYSAAFPCRNATTQYEKFIQVKIIQWLPRSKLDFAKPKIYLFIFSVKMQTKFGEPSEKYGDSYNLIRYSGTAYKEREKADKQKLVCPLIIVYYFNNRSVIKYFIFLRFHKIIVSEGAKIYVGNYSKAARANESWGYLYYYKFFSNRCI